MYDYSELLRNIAASKTFT